MRAAALLAPLLATALLAAEAARAQEPAPIPEHPRELDLPPTRPYAPALPAARELARGARLLVVAERSLSLVDGRLLLRGGAALDPADAGGTCEVLARALRDGGSEATPGGALDDWLDARGAQLSIAAERDALRIDFSCLADDLPGLLGFVGELLARPAYPEAAVERARRAVLTSIGRRGDDAAALAELALDQVTHGADTPWSRQPTPASVARIDRGRLLAFHRGQLGIDRLVAGLVGDVDADALAERLDAVLQELPVLGPVELPPPPAFVQPDRTRVFVLDRPGVPQTELRLAAPGVRRLHPDYSALYLWSHVVGIGGSTNRVMVRLRSELALAYVAGAYHRPGWHRSGRVEAFCATRNEAVGRAARELVRLLRGGLEPIPGRELEAARRRLLNTEVFRWDEPVELLTTALDLAFHDYPADFWKRHEERLAALTGAEVVEAARRTIDPDRLVVVAVGPAAEIVEPLSALGPVERFELGDPVPTLAADAAPRLAQLFAALGGRAAWRELRAVRRDERLVARDASGETELALTSWLDLDGPSARVEQGEGADARVLVVGPDGAWMRTAETLVDVPPARHAELLSAAWRDPHRLLHLLAREDAPAVLLDERGRLTVADGLAAGVWIELDDDGLPRRIGQAEHVLELDGWRPLGGSFAPVQVVKRPDGWRRRVVGLERLDAPDPELFARP